MSEPQLTVSTRRGLPAVIEAMRIPHWVKNGFVAAPLLFSGKYDNLMAWGRCIAAVLAYCFLSSAVYLINDVADRKADQAHPVKKNRPVPSGRLSVTGAIIAACVLIVMGLGIAVAVELAQYDPNRPLRGMELVVWTVTYLVLNLLYSFWLKRHSIVDVIMVAMGFVLRAMAGAAAIMVPISPWLVVCTFTLCLFIALTKRRGEIITLPEGHAGQARHANRSYDLRDLEHMLTVSTAMALLTYSIYCLAPTTIDRIHSAHMIWTIPVVVYGMFRYNRITRHAGKSDPVSVLIHDRVMWAVAVLYVALVLAVMTLGRLPAVRVILDGMKV